ncbi:hypothetical protein OOK31_25440 [Streptomyces sp. NBC_00249]|uniref:hypothetical protein n=1 Tax=Streptomyces sp. NBC_00249 TaxID=2975690 RepID=UPI00224F01D9|nr:hypothetical protein [Streptomyces sp. NBC_00249]MCX5197201.1 hypothetical protein [Streptomyces sp. NBC_00249]
MTTSPAALHLTRIATLWPHLDDALDQRGTNWLASRRDLFAVLDQVDREEAAALRALERDPQQIGETPAPVSLRILDTARLVESTLVHLADTLAPQITRPALTHAPVEWEARGWTPTDRAIRNQCADYEQADPRRWRYVGLRTAEYAAGWLHARVTFEDGYDAPFWPLTAAQHLHVEQVTEGCADRIAAALDLTTRAVPAIHPCPDCAGRIVVTTGAGRIPSARCEDCARGWTLPEPVAA